MKSSWLSTHKHIRNFAYVGVVLVTIVILTSIFGRDMVGGWLENLAASKGYNLTPIVEEVK